MHDFPHEEWDAKKAHFRLATELIHDVSVCRVYAGLFLEDSIGPWFGFDTKTGKYEAVGDPAQRTSYTSMHDVGKALAVLALRTADTVPPEMHLSGDSKSMLEILKITSTKRAEQRAANRSYGHYQPDPLLILTITLVAEVNEAALIATPAIQ